MHELGTATDEALHDLAMGVHAIAHTLGEPTLRTYDGFDYWRFEATDEWPIIVVKAARVVSALNAMRVLARAGFTQEAQVINRTINDFLHEIAALIEPQINPESQAARRRILDEFYGEPIPHKDFLARIAQGRPRAGRKQVTAASARVASREDPVGMASELRAVSAVLDGYVHGAYIPSMELYDPNRRAFQMQGSRSSPYVSWANEQIAMHTERALSIVAGAAHFRELDHVAQMLAKRRRAYYDSPDHPSST